MNADPHCIFCKIVAGQVPAKKAYEDEQLLAFHDINPWAPVHILIVPKRHITSMADVTMDDQALLGRMLALSPRLMRELRLFAVLDDDRSSKLAVSAIHDEPGYRALRRKLADQYNLGSQEPNIQVWNVDRRGDRTLTLRYFPYQRRPLSEQTPVLLRHLASLWGFKVRLEQQAPDGHVTLLGEHVMERRR